MARIIPKRTLEEIRFRNDIVDVIGAYFTLKRAGSAFKAVCPFHKEKTPSFHVNPQRQIFHCFGCGAGGDVFGFMMQYEGLDFVGAAKMLAQRAGVPLELEEDDNPGGGPRKEALYEIHRELAEFYRRCLAQMRTAEVARDYLKQRDLPTEIVDEFLVGYAPNRWDAALKWAAKHKYSTEQLEAAGVIVRKPESADSRPQFYDRFRNRLMFPILDEQNRVIGFSGRTLESDSRGAKYVNSPETPLFHKSRILYALGMARRHIVDTREAIVCEGQIDVIRCHCAGFKTAVASQGTAFTDDHARILKRYADSVCIVFDTDTAGQDAAVKAATIFMDAGLAVRVATLPKDEDPDSFIRQKGAPAFQQVLDQAESAVDFQIRVLSSRENARSEIGAMRIAKAVLATISHSPNAVQRAKLIQAAAERLNLPASALHDDLRHAQRTQKPRFAAAEPEPPPPHTERPREEVALCEHVVHIVDNPELGLLVEHYLPLDALIDPTCRTVVEAALEAAAAGRDIHDVLRDCPDPSGELLRFGAAMQMAPSKVSGREWSRADAVKDLILGIWRRKLQLERTTTPDQERRRQITYDLKALKNWEDGAPIIELELGSRE